MKKRLVSIIAVVVLVSVFATNVFAYPVSPNTYEMTTTPADDLTDVETVVYRAESETDYAYSPAICITESGRIIVSYDISAKRGEVKYSDDGGVTWTKATLSDEAFIFARPFETESGLYLIARRYAASADEGNGQLIMYKSDDNGATWGTASVINTNVWHSAPSEVMHLNGYVYMTWEIQDLEATNLAGGAGRGTLAPVVLRARETDDLIVASNWTVSDSADTSCYSYWDAVDGNSFDAIDYMGVPFRHYRYGNGSNVRHLGWLEGNIVRITDPSHVLYDEDAFYIYLRSSANTSDYANLMKIKENEDGTMTSELVTTSSGKTLLYVQLPGGQSKFYITYDEQDELYWLVSNVSTDSMEKDTTWGAGADTDRHEGPQDVRNELGLYYSANAMDWNFAGTVSATDSISQARSYPSMVIDGNDLLVVSRSGDENAASAHNTNLITFHRINDFRRLANAGIISEEQDTLVYSPGVLDDSSVTDTHTYITESGTTLVACSFSDETSTTSKVLVKQEDGTYVERLSTGYKLGEPFEVNGTTYVFGVAEYKLVAFTSTDEGATWSGPYAIDTTRDWYEAPSSVIVNDETVMMALSEVVKGTYVPLRGYNTETTGSVAYDEVTDTADFYGYGAATYTEAFYLEEGDSLSFQVTPSSLVTSNANDFGIAFLNAPTFFGNAADYADGFAINIKTNSDYTTGYFHVYTSYVSDGTVPNLAVGTERVGSKTLAGGLLNQNLEVRFTKKTQTISDVDYAWQLSVTYTDENSKRTTLTKNIPASQVPANAFENGLWFSAGARSGKVIQYKVADLAIKKQTGSKWEAYTGTNYTKTATDNGDGSVSMKARAAAYYKDKIAVQEGTKISYDVTFPVVVANATIQYGFALTSVPNEFYYNNASAVTGNSISAELTGTSNTQKLIAQGAIRKAGEGRAVKVGASTVTSDWTTVGSKKYTITYEKQPSTSSYSWVMTVAERGGSTVTMNINATDFAHDLLDGEVYIVAGSATGAAHEVKISNVNVIQPEETIVTEPVAAATDSKEAYLASPVIMTASVSSTLTEADCWTYYERGESFANKIGNAYTNTKLDYFGIPYETKDIRTIGWTDLKLFEIHETDDIRHDNQLNADETTGNIYGYMTLQNAGYDYAAFVKVNTKTKKIEFFTPTGLSEEVTEEEMVFSKLPGGNNGFEIIYDEVSSLYWLVTTENTDSTNKTSADAAKIAVYYGTNAYDWRSAGVVAEVSKDACVSAKIDGTNLVIAALDENVVQYMVPNFRELADKSGLGDWSQIKIRGTSSAYTIQEDDNLVTLSNFGAATCNQRIDIAEGTKISFKVKGTTLIAGQAFAVGLTDTYGSFPGRINDTTYFDGDGIVASIIPFGNLNGAAIRYANVATAKYNITNDSINKETGKGISNTTMTNNEITFTFIKRSQTISDVAYSWVIEWEEANGKTTGSYLVPASDVSDTLFDNGAYLFAGCRTGGSAVYEIRDITVTQSVVGDVNCDGEINILDIVAIDYGVRDASAYESYEKHVYNVNNDDVIDWKDVAELREQVLAH